MNFSKKHCKMDFQKDASMIAGVPVTAKVMYWKKANNLSYDELAYLINDKWTIYGKCVKDILFSKEGS